MDSTIPSNPSGIASWSFWKPFLVGLVVVGFTIVGFAIVFPDPFTETSPVPDSNPYIAENPLHRAIPVPIRMEIDAPVQPIIEGKLLSEFQLNPTNSLDNFTNTTQFSMFRLEELDGKMIYRIRTLAQGDELIIDAVTGKLISIRDSNGRKILRANQIRVEAISQPM
jgi:hypothetical protein